MIAPLKTSLSELDDQEWAILSNRWARGANWNVTKSGRKWVLTEQLQQRRPPFKTKTAAWEAGSALITAESHYRGYIRNKKA